MRQPIITANWKMHKTMAEATAFARAFLPKVENLNIEIALAAPFTALSTLAPLLEGSKVKLAAENVHPEEAGAFTGEISPPMLVEIGCAYAIVGHSERRTLFGEDDALVARKTAALLAHGIRPIVCVGENEDEREANRTFDVVGKQLEGSLAQVPIDQWAEVVLAYEPLWAIGTGKTATPETAQEVHAFIRDALRQRIGQAADAIRLQYGGSVKPENVATLMAQADIDGALVGGASLDPDSFATLLRLA